MRSRRVLAVAVSALVVMIVGVGVSVARGERSPSPGDARAASAQATAFETDVAKRLGISRATLEAARKAVTLADVAFAEDNGFISSTQANFLRKAIRSEPGAGPGPLGLEGHLGFGVGLGGFPLLGPTGVEGGMVTGRFGGRSDTLAAAASYLGLSEGRLMQSLRSETLAQVARDTGKSVHGLELAMRSAIERGLDRWVAEGLISRLQEHALLGWFDEHVADLANGVPPTVTDLARRLGIDRDEVIAAIKDAAIDRVDAARTRGLITRLQADAIKQRIRNAPGLPLGIGLPCAGPGGPPMGRARAGFGPPAPFLGGRGFDHGPMQWGRFS